MKCFDPVNRGWGCWTPIGGRQHSFLWISWRREVPSGQLYVSTGLVWVRADLNSRSPVELFSTQKMQIFINVVRTVNVNCSTDVFHHCAVISFTLQLRTHFSVKNLFHWLINSFTCHLSHLSQVDCTAHSETCGRFGVSGYPTLKIFRNGRDSAPYDGPRTAGKTNKKHKHINKQTNKQVCWTLCVCVCVCSDGIYHYMKKQTGPDSVHLKTEEDLQTFINHYDASVIGTIRYVTLQVLSDSEPLFSVSTQHTVFCCYVISYVMLPQATTVTLCDVTLHYVTVCYLTWL